MSNYNEFTIGLSNLPFTATFNNMRTPKLKDQPTNVFFAAVNHLLGGSSQLPTTQCGSLFRCLNSAQRFD